MATPIVIVNSQDYSDILSAAVYARANDYNFVFALTPNQSVFIAHYYTLSKNDSVIYLEGQRTILPNMAALLSESSANVSINAPPSVPGWVADQMPKEQAIVVGSQYGQDGLAVAPYAALTKSPIFFVDNPSQAGAVLSNIAARHYSRVLVYGAVAHELPADQLALLPNERAIDTGSRYSNNVEIAREFLQHSPTGQVMFVSGSTFEKSMVDKQFPLILVGRSDVSADVATFLKSEGVTTGVVFAGDADIVDGVNKLRAQLPALALFVKFAEGYPGSLGSAEPLPLMVIPLPAPVISLEVLNLTYNVPAKRFELRVANHGDFVALTAGVSVSGTGSAQSSQILMDPNSTTTLPIPLDATAALSGRRVPAADLTIRYGEDVKLLDNIDVIHFSDIPTSDYSDNSSVQLISVDYSDEQKAFLITLLGNGWTEGTLQFTINSQPITLHFAPVQVNGRTIVSVKYLLTADQEKFVDKLALSYFLRTGARADILLHETRGQAPISSPGPSSGIGGLGGSSGGSGSLPLGPICAVAGLLALAGGVYYFFARRGGGNAGGFD